MTPARADHHAPNWLIWTALWVVYLVWGSTYLAIRVVVETMPPLMTAGVRFIIAGLVLYLVLRIRRGRAAMRVTRSQLGSSALIGTLLLLGGNGLVSIAEKEVPSGLTALLIAAVPLWVVLWRTFARDKVPGGTLIGVAVGFIGVAVLVLPGEQPDGASVTGMLTIVLASSLWATGSFFSKRVDLPRDPLIATTMEMLSGGAIMLVAGLVRGEASEVVFSDFSAASLLGFVYLIVFGSLLAFTAYVWLLQHAPISQVATYAYVNPVVAIFLGWLILDESITTTIVIGAAVICASVAAIVRIESLAEKRALAAEVGHPGAAPPASDAGDVSASEAPSRA